MDNYLRNIASQELLGLSERKLITAGAIHTAREIAQQPLVWRKIYSVVLAEHERISRFMHTALAQPKIEIILTGAGSSSFIGSVLEGSFAKLSSRVCRAVATTDLLTHPEHYVRKTTPVLLVSFARSGNSPESTAVVDLIKSVCNQVYHLIITCNENGKLAKKAGTDDKELVLLLPAETDDKSLVMTSSFTGMLVAGILITRINQIEELKREIDLLAEYGEKNFCAHIPMILRK